MRNGRSTITPSPSGGSGSASIRRLGPDRDGRAGAYAMRARRRMLALLIRTQPWLALVPISAGRLVPWIATRPLPPANSLSVSE